jgi:histidine phosphotransferase ChpT
MAVEAQDENLMLAQAVTRRICHDLAGLLGTLGGTLELATDDPEAAALALETAGAAAARLKLLRGAWGGGVEALDAAALQAMLPGLHGAERLQLNAASLTAPLDGAAARLCLCLLLVAGPALPKGGAIHLGGNEASVWVELEGAVIAWPAALADSADAAWEDAAAPRALPHAFCRLLAVAEGWELRVSGARVTAEQK